MSCCESFVVPLTGDAAGSGGGGDTPRAAGDGIVWYGNGADGDLVFDGVATVTGTGLAGLSLAPAAGVYTLTRSLYALSMTVSPGVRIQTAGYRIFVLNTLTNDGEIGFRANNGNNGTAGAGGTGGAAIASTVFFSNQAGGNGGGPDAGTGGSPSAGGAPGIAVSHFGGVQGANVVNGGAGGVLQGGAGGTNSIGSSGGIVGTLPAYAFTLEGNFFTIFQAMTGRTVSGANQIGSGSSGGGGRGAGLSVGGGGGGGGASGGTVLVAARIIAGAGTIAARGGNGGNGNGGGGGGGGGAGGVVSVVTDSEFPISNTIDVSGGTGGTGGGSGGQNGGAGGTGLIYRFNP